MANKNKVGLAFGAFLGVFHLSWAILVALGWAQGLMDWILKLHMIKPFFEVQSFSVGLAFQLILVTSVFGYIGGWALAALWNIFQGKQ